MIKRLEEATLLWLSISKVVHNEVKSDDLVRLWKQGLLIIWHEREVIEIVQLIDERRIWVGIGIIVNQPSCHIPVQPIRDRIEE
jgi:hypothetical protein